MEERVAALEARIREHRRRRDLAEEEREYLEHLLAEMRKRVAETKSSLRTNATGASGTGASGTGAPRTGAPIASAKSLTALERRRIIKGAIRKTGLSRLEIRRDFLRAVVADSGLYSTDARIVPTPHGAKPAGFRLQKLNPGGVFHALGFRPGDIVTTFAAVPMTSPDRILAVAFELPKMEAFTVHVVRAGREMVFRIAVK